MHHKEIDGVSFNFNSDYSGEVQIVTFINPVSEVGHKELWVLFDTLKAFVEQAAAPAPEPVEQPVTDNPATGRVSAAPALLTPEQIESLRVTLICDCDGLPADAIDKVCDMAHAALRLQAVVDAEPVAWKYALVVDGEEVKIQHTNANWNTAFQPFGRKGIDHCGIVTKTPLIPAPTKGKS